MNDTAPDFDAVRDYLTGLQDRTCAAIESSDGEARFTEDAYGLERANLAGAIIDRVEVIEDLENRARSRAAAKRKKARRG